jgi:hypothetical protein
MCEVSVILRALWLQWWWICFKDSWFLKQLSAAQFVFAEPGGKETAQVFFTEHRDTESAEAVCMDLAAG